MEENYHLARYTDVNGDNTKGQWCLTKQDLEDERIKMEKVPHLKMHQTKTISVKRKQVKDLAEKNNMEMADILKHVKI